MKVSMTILSKIWNLIDNYYYIPIGLYCLYKAVKIALHSNAGADYKAYMFILAFAALTAYSDLRKDVKWIPFLVLTVPFMLFVSYACVHGYSFWGKILSWQISKKIVVDLNPIFQQIPFNDGSIFRIYKPETLTWILRMIYNNGFVIPLLIPLYRAVICKDFKKAIRYALSGHLLQIFLISPFYLTFHLQEVWYVLGQPDGLARHLGPQAAAGVTLNCFPSMHTSIAFAMFLVVMREKNKLFKYVWGLFCLSVIFSTLYLEIHWVLDVIGGLILAYVTVKLVDIILDKGKAIISRPLNNIYYKNKVTSSTVIKNYYLDTL
ncbi:inositol phosphorylceramide synthase [Clostridium fermenticellae]|uniref:Inositol phosphorylceramide synthase n=2 Tax=Clostridium fermenticellae TaxID=2068654 RepID=A0A386H772_9CLOT|nr:inositol phosphorylceramide synthase [Clostridium fermenticellae]